MTILRLFSAVLAILALNGCAGSLPGGLLTSETLVNEGEEVTVAAENGLPPLPSRRVAAANTASAPAEQKPDAGGLMGSLAAILPEASEKTAAPDTAYTQSDPVSAYTQIARGIRGCWLSATQPVLAGHKFHAEAKPDGEASIIIYRKVEGAKLGVAVFRVKITPDSSGTVVRSENVKLTEDLKQSFQNDVAAWTKGGNSCEARKTVISASAKPL